MRKNVEKIVGFLVIIAVFIGGAVACGWYIAQNKERQTGALALAIAILLIAAVWQWLKGRMPSND